MLKLNEYIYVIQYNVDFDTIDKRICKTKVIGILVNNNRYIYSFNMPNGQAIRASNSEIIKHTTKKGIRYRYKFYLNEKQAKEAIKTFIQDNKDELLLSIDGRIAELKETKKSLKKRIISVDKSILNLTFILKKIEIQITKVTDSKKKIDLEINLNNNAIKKLKKVINDFKN